MSEEKITLELTPAEALVLYEFLTRFSKVDLLRIEDQAEARVLWDMCCLLERRLVEPFARDYDRQLEKARDAVRDEEA